MAANPLDDVRIAGSFRVRAHRPVGWYPVGPELELSELVGPLKGLPLATRVAALRDTKIVASVEVVLAIGRRRRAVDKLFTLSQAGLLRLHRTLRYLRMDLRLADIPFAVGSTGADTSLAA